MPSSRDRRVISGLIDIEVVDPNRVTLDLSQDTWLKVGADPEKGFNFPYLLFVPKGIDPAADRHLFVETNNTGRTSDDLQVHEKAAVRLVHADYTNRIARELGTPLLVPVFPRPATEWQIYTHSLDEDTTLSRDAFCEEHSRLIREQIGAEMPERWRVSQSIYKELGLPAQCVTYNGSGHEIKREMIDDVVRFFRANSGEGFVAIQPHEYPFVEFAEIKVAHINGLYWQGDERIPEALRGVHGDKGGFIISIDDWMTGQDHRQLDAFRGHTVFRFLLKAQGHEDIRITEKEYGGNCSSGRGEFQGFYVNLPPSELAKIVPGASYTIMPVEQRTEYTWQVKEGVQLVRQ
jgi:hypothetical protein